MIAFKRLTILTVVEGWSIGVPLPSVPWSSWVTFQSLQIWVLWIKTVYPGIRDQRPGDPEFYMLPST